MPDRERREIAVTAVKTRDGKLRDLLAANGIAINPAPPEQPASASGGSAPAPAPGNRD